MTANAFAEERERCLSVGMNDHVAKPVVAEQLFATLYRWLVWREEADKQASSITAAASIQRPTETL